MDKEISNTINVNLYDTDVYAEYGYENREQVQQSFIDTVKSMADAKPLKEKLTLLVTKPKGTKIDNDRFRKAYGNTLANIVSTKTNEMRRCLVTGIVFFVMAIALLALNVFVFASIGGMLYAVTNLLAFVFGFVGVEALSLELIQLIIEIKKFKRIMSVEIRIIDAN